jgi:hypothetical protein
MKCSIGVLCLVAAVCVMPQWASIGRAADDDAAEQEALEQAAVKSINNLKQIMIAVLNFHDVTKGFPPAVRVREGKPLLSWRVSLLPFLEEPNARQLYKEFHLDEPWDSEHNKTLIAKMPAVYQSPHSKLKDGRTVYLTPRGDSTAFPAGKAVRIREVTDGTSKTIAVLEVDDDRAVIWSKPDDWQYDANDPHAGLGHQTPEGFLCAFLDASVHFLPNTTDSEILNKLFTRNGREPVDVPME